MNIFDNQRSQEQNKELWVISPWWQRRLLHSKLIRLAFSPLLITRENQSSFLRPIRGDWTQWVHLGVLIGTNMIAFSLHSQFVRLYAVIVCNAFRGTKMHPVCLRYIKGVTQSHCLHMYLATAPRIHIHPWPKHKKIMCEAVLKVNYLYSRIFFFWNKWSWNINKLVANVKPLRPGQAVARDE